MIKELKPLESPAELLEELRMFFCNNECERQPDHDPLCVKAREQIARLESAPVCNCEELAGALRNTPCKCNTSDPECAIDCQRCSALAAYESRASGAEDGWIAVGERLPEQRKPVLAMGNGYVEVAVWRSPPNSFATHHGGYLQNVTHWRPLPAPPRTGQGGKEQG